MCQFLHHRAAQQRSRPAALERSSHLLTRFGGHKQAAGLTLDAARVRELRLAVNEVADETLGPEDLMPRLRIDGDLSFRGISGDVALKQDGRIFRAIAWRAAERHDYLTEHRAALDVAFSLEQNAFGGETFVELSLSDAKTHDS